MMFKKFKMFIPYRLHHWVLSYGKIICFLATQVAVADSRNNSVFDREVVTRFATSWEKSHVQRRADWKIICIQN